MTLQFPAHGLIIGAVRGGHAMQYMTSRQKATEWSVTKRMVNYWCANGQIEGAYKEGSRWWIPVDVERPGEEECLRRMRAYTVRITGKKSVAVGIQDFEALRRDQMFYVDKTDFIRQWWESGETTTLITRPRRFGKTLNLSMLNCFFSVSYENRADLFEGLKVWEEKSYHKLQGRFPVIFLSFAGVKGTTFEAVLRQINYGIIEVYRRFERILDMSRFTERERQDFGRISWDMDASTAAQSVRLLTDLLYVYYGHKPIILLDEYDTPLQEAYFNSFWDEMVSFVGAFFNNSFKTNPSLGRALLTGITRICKESIFSDLNNIDVVAQTSTKYETAFGFTEEEVKVGLARVGLLDYREKVKEWYDGYRFGKADVYCPWDVVNYCNDHIHNPEAEPENYWMNTSGNNVIHHFIDSINETDMLTKTELEWLVNGKTVIKQIDEMVTYNDLYSTMDHLWSTLFMTGYLTQRGRESDGRYCLAIPNREIRNIITERILTLFQQEVKKDGKMAEQFCQALLGGKAAEVESLLDLYLQKTVSVRDTFVRKSLKENFYHGILLGILSYKNDWRVSSNRESGEGFSDIVIEMGNAETGIVIEVKYTDEKKDLERDCRKALEQIRDKDYTQTLWQEGYKKWCSMGLHFI